MDIKSILRTFRYTELQAKAERDPNAKRPPTIKFLAVALVVGLMGFGFALLVMNFDEGSGSDGSVLTVSESTDSTNQTASPSPAAQIGPEAQRGPSSTRIARPD